MGGFFGFFDYSKVGPGVPKDAPKKAAIVVLFEIFTRKFWNLMKINFIFFLFNLPAVIGVLYVSQVFVQSKLGESAGMDLVIRFIGGTILLCIPLVTVGPAQAGFTYVLRNYAREEHAWIWSDFKEHALKNLKESMIICVIDFIVVIIVGLDINIYLNLKDNSLWVTLASVLLIMSFLIYMMMHLYIYPMLVTFKITVRQIYKNAFIFAIMNIFKNIGILLICIVLILATFLFPVVGFILFPFITMSAIGLITNFFVYPSIKKYMLDKVETSDDVVEEEQLVKPQ